MALPISLPSESPVLKLDGLSLEGGWMVGTLIPRRPGATGGNFSRGYVVNNVDGRQGFLKAIDLWRAFRSTSGDVIDEFQQLLGDFLHERDILEFCRNRRMGNVVVSLAQGEVSVPGYPQNFGRVPYLIFELAIADARQQVQANKRYDTAWALRAANDVAKGLAQCHQASIAHQDGKPSNVLVYTGTICRIADFGRASMKGRSARHDSFTVAGGGMCTCVR